MPHTLILGMTETGKTTLAKSMVNAYRAQGTRCGVLDPMGTEWGADFQTTDIEEFKYIYLNNSSMALFIDEAGLQGKYNDIMITTACSGRHRGHNMHYIAQSLTMLHPHLRGNCRYLAIFQIKKGDCKVLHDEYPYDSIREAWKLPQGHYYWLSRFGGVQKRRIF